jgi:hypothetical protein
MNYDEIVQKIMDMAPSLVRLDWCPFSHNVVLHFCGGNDRCALTLGGVHLFATRQSQFGSKGYIPIDESNHEDWFVDYLAVHSEGTFLESFLERKLGFDSHNFCTARTMRRRGRLGFRSQFTCRW